MASSKEIYDRMQNGYFFYMKRQGKPRELADDHINAALYAVAAELEFRLRTIEEELVNIKQAAQTQSNAAAKSPPQI